MAKTADERLNDLEAKSVFQEDTIERLSQEMQLEDRVLFLGKQDAIVELLSISDLFIMPSGNESFGLSALEAMACEVPIISSNVGGLPEVNIHQQTGFLSDVGDIESMSNNAIHLLKNPALHETFRANALEQAKRFDIANIIPQYEKVYSKALSLV